MTSYEKKVVSRIDFHWLTIIIVHLRRISSYANDSLFEIMHIISLFSVLLIDECRHLSGKTESLLKRVVSRVMK